MKNYQAEVGDKYDNQKQKYQNQNKSNNAQKQGILEQNVKNLKNKNEIEEKYENVDVRKRQKNIMNKKMSETTKNSNVLSNVHTFNIDEYILDNSDDDIAKLNIQNHSKSSNTTTKESESFINLRSSKKCYEKYQDRSYFFQLNKQKCQSEDEFTSKTIYQDNFEKKNHCQGCIQKQHKLNSLELLKSEYYKSILLLKHQIEQLKNNKDKDQQNQRSSISLNEILDRYNDESQRSQFSFQNIENNLLAQRFVFQAEQLTKLIDKTLLLELNLTDITAWNTVLISDLQKKLNQLKSYLKKTNLHNQQQADPFEIQQKRQLKTKIIQQKYKKIIQKIIKGFKQKQKRILIDFEKVNLKFIEVLNQKQDLANQIQKMRKSEKKDVTSPSPSLKDLKNIGQGFSNSRKNIFLKGISLQNMVTILEQKNTELERNIQKSNIKIKDLQKNNKKNQKKIQEIYQQLMKNKKKSSNEIFVFMERLSKSQINQKTIKTENNVDTTKIQKQQKAAQTIHSNKAFTQKIFFDKNDSFLISQISQIVYEIFTYTSDDFDTQQNIFCPQSKQELLKMLQHIKEFNKNFDSWQKEKQKQIINFQKNFLKLIKFFIDSYKISEQKLIQQIDKIQNNQSLKDYIRKYYHQFIIQEKNRQFSQSSQFTFGKASLKEMSDLDKYSSDEFYFGTKDQI